MALLKTKPDKYGGVGVSYWKIIETNINWFLKLSHVSLGGFVNKSARDDDRQPVEFVQFDWGGDEYQFDLALLNEAGENILKVAYGKIKASILDDNGAETNWFADATDV